MKQIPASILTLLAGVVITLVSLWVGQNHGLLPVQASEQAPLVDGFFNVMVTIGTALFIVVQGVIVFSVIRFRRRAGDDSDGSPIEGNVSLEIFWTAIPAVIVIGLGVYSVQVYEQMGGFSPGSTMIGHVHPTGAVAHQVPKGSAIAAPLLAADKTEQSIPHKHPPVYGLGTAVQEAGKPIDLVVNVTGMQFAWIFEYPDRGVTSGELHLPLGKTVLLNFKATDVIHSFWVPQFRMKQDVMPGLQSDMQLVATKTGTFPIFCAELCGSYHGSMRSQTIVHTPEAFEQWLAESQVAQKPDQRAIASHPAARSNSEFLAPYAEELGVSAQTLAQLHSSAS